MRLRTNLATRPFYNVRAVHVLLVATAVVVIGLSLFNVARLWQLTSSQRTLGARASQAESDALRLRLEAERIRTQIDQKELESVAAAAREANTIIDRRAFSWTALLTLLESALPNDVRITTVQPRPEKGAIRVGLIAEAHRAEDVAAFIDALEKTGAFHNVVPVQQQIDEEGVIQVAIDSDYQAPARENGSARTETPSGAGRD